MGTSVEELAEGVFLLRFHPGGQGWGTPWTWCCVAVVRDGVAELKAAVSAPPRGARKPVIEALRVLGASRLSWERRTSGTTRAVEVSVGAPG